MKRLVRISWAARLAAFAVVAGLLAQVAFAIPARLAMAQAVPVCGTPQPGGVGDGPVPASHDHAHCLLCQAPSGPSLLVSHDVPVPSAGCVGVVRASAASGSVAPGTAAGFRARAPPALV